MNCQPDCNSAICIVGQKNTPALARTGNLLLRRQLLYPVELRGQFGALFNFIGVRGFEPPTPCSQSKCAARLRHTPLSSDENIPAIGCSVNIQLSAAFDQSAENAFFIIGFIPASARPRWEILFLFSGVKSASATSIPVTMKSGS